MKTMTVAGALLALALGGCTMTGPGSGSESSMSNSGSRSSMSGSGSRSSAAYSGSSYHSQYSARSDPADVHYENFGDPNNMPFNGDYSANW